MTYVYITSSTYHLFLMVKKMGRTILSLQVKLQRAGKRMWLLQPHNSLLVKHETCK